MIKREQQSLTLQTFNCLQKIPSLSRPTAALHPWTVESYWLVHLQDHHLYWFVLICIFLFITQTSEFGFLPITYEENLQKLLSCKWQPLIKWTQQNSFLFHSFFLYFLGKTSNLTLTVWKEFPHVNILTVFSIRENKFPLKRFTRYCGFEQSTKLTNCTMHTNWEI